MLLVLAGMIAFLVIQGLPSMRHYGFFSSVTSTRWAPSEATASKAVPNPYGIVQFMYGTIVTSLSGMIIAVPLAIGVALVITDVAPQRLRRPLSSLVDVLAAVPSVVYGFWGIFALKPAITPVVNLLSDSLGDVPVIGAVFSGPFFGFSYFTAGLIGDHARAFWTSRSGGQIRVRAASGYGTLPQTIATVAAADGVSATLARESSR